MKLCRSFTFTTLCAIGKRTHSFRFRICDPLDSTCAFCFILLAFLDWPTRVGQSRKTRKTSLTLGLTLKKTQLDILGLCSWRQNAWFWEKSLKGTHWCQQPCPGIWVKSSKQIDKANEKLPLQIKTRTENEVEYQRESFYWFRVSVGYI